MSLPNSVDSAAGAQRLQRGKSSGKLRFGKDKLFRTQSSGSSPPGPRASDASLASSDGEDLTSWHIESHAALVPAPQRLADDQHAIHPRCASLPGLPAGVQPLDNSACNSLDDLEVLATIGTGTFGQVKLARRRCDDTFFALKVLRKEQLLRLKQVQHVVNERRLLAAVDHPNIVKMYGTFQDDAKLYMVMEFVPGGELFGHLRAAGRFTVAAARFYIACVVSALDHLHRHDIVYRDLKPENLLIAPSGYVKLCDFGFAKQLGPGPRARTFTLCGTAEYLAPELLASGGHGKGVDWWAVGVLLFEMLAGHPPWQDGNTFAVYRSVMRGRLAFPHHFDPDAQDLVRALLAKDAAGRLGCGTSGGTAVKRHPFLTPIDWGALHAGLLEPPFVPQLDGLGDRRHFGRCAEISLDGGGAEALPALLAAGGGQPFREF